MDSGSIIQYEVLKRKRKMMNPSFCGNENISIKENEIRISPFLMSGLNYKYIDDILQLNKEDEMQELDDLIKRR